MASTQLEQWLEKYWQGELSQVEEMQFRSELKANKEQLKGELLELAEWFEGLEEGKQQISLDESFDDAVLNAIRQPKASVEKWSWWKIAASVVIILGLGYFAWLAPSQERNNLVSKNTQENPEKAYQEAKATLQLMASVMNSGKQHLGSLEMINVAQEKVKKTFQPDNNSKKKEKDS